MSDNLKDLYAQSQERLVTSYDENDSLRSEIAGHCDEMNLLRGALKDYQDEETAKASGNKSMKDAAFQIYHLTLSSGGLPSEAISAVFDFAYDIGKVHVEQPKQAEKGIHDALRS